MLWRTFILLIVVYGMACQRSGDPQHVPELITMIRKLQSHVSSVEEELKDVVDKIVDHQESLLQVQLCASTVPKPIRDCQTLYRDGMTSDGVYTIYVDDTPMNVYCDMTNGGWIVLQKRTDDTLNYTRDFVDYEQGFGDVSGEHWLGLRQMNLLTESESNHWVVRFDLEDFHNETRWAEYREFRISAGSNYTLTFDEHSYRGTAGDTGAGLSYHNGMKFSSSDHDQDLDDDNCAENYGGGGWWYRYCSAVLTTGMPYGHASSVYAIKWYDWKYDSLKSAIIKIKRA